MMAAVRARWRVGGCGGAPRGLLVFAIIAVAGAMVGPTVTWVSGPSIAYPPAHADITYIYDALGRLVGVVDPAGDRRLPVRRRRQSPWHRALRLVHRQHHRRVSGQRTCRHRRHHLRHRLQRHARSEHGHLQWIERDGDGPSATQLTVTVPVAATTGPVAVTAPGGSATSPSPFTVTGSTAPTITGFTPSIGTSGTAVSISGTNFEAVPSRNRLLVNVARGVVSSATTSTLGATVPLWATSGRLTVANPAGTAQSTADFFVPPPGFTTADVIVTGRITVGGSSLNTTIAPAYKIGLVVFDGTAGQIVSLGTTGVSINQATVTIFRPDGTTLIAQPQDGNGGRDIHPGALPVTGTYTILLDPWTYWTGNMTLTLSQDLTPVPIAINGAAVPVSITRPAQRAPLTFSGTTGQRLSLALTAATVSVKVTILKPDGSVLTQTGYGAAFLDLAPLPVTGTYTILIDPQDAGTGSMTTTLSEDIAGEITIGGAAVPVTISRPGQRARLTFSGTAGSCWIWGSRPARSPAPGSRSCRPTAARWPRCRSARRRPRSIPTCP